ncbi:DNA polymerase III subunit delta' [Johnsonella ignava]|uniref:DNA polymerase III subunit delta' n=1 Tax=Johnsonella ignava TaxID=43995 RepID=UPI0023F20058|nr:DNA polymerase III subunit delta' [Johnsonella ignava]
MLSYNDIYGQDNIKNYLKMIKQKNKIMHAYIINEEKGMGAQELAKVWAAHLLCKNDLNECCKKCHSCIQMKADLHPDFIFISPYKKNSIGVDDIRESINSTLNIMPYMGGYKIYVIKDAHKMTVQAQNALLKTIEEPPEYVIIILLCTNMDMLLETIKSRCIKLRLLPQAEDAIKKNLIKSGVSEDKAAMYAAYARGNIGTAQRLYEDEDFRNVFFENIEILESIGWGENGALTKAMEIIKNRKDNFNDFIEFCRIWYRDVLIVKKINIREMLIFKKQYTSIKAFADNLKYSDLYRIFNAFDRAYDRLIANVNPDIIVHTLLLELKTRLRRIYD